MGVPLGGSFLRSLILSLSQYLGVGIAIRHPGFRSPQSLVLGAEDCSPLGTSTIPGLLDHHRTPDQKYCPTGGTVTLLQRLPDSFSDSPPVTLNPGGLLSARLRSYPAGVQVFVSAHGNHFHSEASCARIRMGQRSKHSSAPVHAVPISSIDGLSPCRSCYPDAPRIKFFKRRCKECGSARPCAHNGGVYVRVPAVYRRGSALMKPGTIIYRRRWVWPDVAWMYEPVGETE